MGLIVPSGLYSDDGTSMLRSLLLDRCRWEWLFCIENHVGIFPIHRSYKFSPVIVEKDGVTEVIRTAFMRRNLDDWERAETIVTPYSRVQIERFSPKSRALLEIQSRRDLDVLEKIYTGSVLLRDDGPDGWGIRFRQGDFNLTSDSRLFRPRPEWESKGYQPDEYSRWLLGNWQPIEELWVSLGIDPARPEPVETELEDWLVDTTTASGRSTRLLHRDLLKDGDVARTKSRLRCAQPPYDGLPVPRVRIPAGVVLSREGNAWIRATEIDEVALPVYQGIMIQSFVPSARGWVSGTGLRATWDYGNLENIRWNPQFLMAEATARQPKRLRLRAILDAVACAAYGLGAADLRHILRDSDLPVGQVVSNPPDTLDARGFWRVDRHREPELRHTVLALVAFHHLQEKIDAAGGDTERGIAAFLDQNDGEGWLLPETLRLTDYGLGHDERAGQPQPVASRLGPRFYDWQLVQGADESWRECHLHARNLLGQHGYALRIVDLIEQRMADGEDYFGLLTDRFKRELLGDAGYVTALVEIRTREALYEGAYWAMVTDLRNAGHLDDRSHDQLLRRLHERELLDDAEPRRQGRATTAPEAGLPAQRVAEPRAGYQADLFPTKKQRDLFE